MSSLLWRNRTALSPKIGDIQPVNSYRIVFCRRLCSLYFRRLTYFLRNTIADLMEIAVCPDLLTVSALTYVRR